MTPNNPRFKIVPYQPRLNNAAARLSQLQADLVSEAVRCAVEDTGAAIAHKLSESLTALLLYLHEIKQADDHATGEVTIPTLTRELVDKAISETERVCDIIEQLGQTTETPLDPETAVARGRDAIDGWTQNNRARDTSHASSAQPLVNQQSLTPREHEVLALITTGVSNKEGSHRLGISSRTFEAHRAHLMGKFGAKNVADLVRMALSNRQ
jgi:DNA-binding CsgD family transcriptional regulator